MLIHLALQVVKVAIKVVEDFIVIAAENGDPDFGPLHIAAGLHFGNGDESQGLSGQLRM